METVGHLCIDSGDTEWCRHCENSQGLPKNLNIDSPCEPATQILGKYPKHLRRDMSIYLYTNIHSSIMHNSQDMETIQHHQQTNG